MSSGVRAENKGEEDRELNCSFTSIAHIIVEHEPQNSICVRRKRTRIEINRAWKTECGGGVRGLCCVLSAKEDGCKCFVTTTQVAQLCNPTLFIPCQQ
jgi:hypothetical protein